MGLVAVMDMGSGTSLLLVVRLFKASPSLKGRVPPRGVDSWRSGNDLSCRRNDSVILKAPSDKKTGGQAALFAEVKEDLIHWTRLSEGYSTSLCQITTAALKRQKSFFQAARALIKKHKVSRIHCVATEAVRKAKNQNQFLKLAQSYGFKVDVLSGEEEARLSARGALWALPPLNKKTLVLDIGGASTELALCQTSAATSVCKKNFPPGSRNTKGKTLNSRFVSLPFGSVTLTQKHIPSFNPPPLNSYQSICDHVQHVLRKNLKGPGGVLPRGTVLVATAGTACTLACLQHQTEDPWPMHGQVLSLKQVRQWRKKLFSLTRPARKSLPGMPPQRADIILAGVSVLENVMVFFSFKKCVVSVTGLRFGLLGSQTGINKNPLFP